MRIERPGVGVLPLAYVFLSQFSFYLIKGAILPFPRAMASVITFLSFLSSKKQIFIHTFSLLLLGILPDMKRHSRTNADTQFFPNFQAVKIKHFPVLFPPTGFLFLNVALHVLLSVLLWGNTRCQENSNPHFPTQNKDICCTFLEP